jgi:lipopolysaccharide export system protein LptA
VTQLAQAKAPVKDEKPRKEGNGTTEITAKEAAFDQKTSQAVFLGEVIVKNPQFNVNCDKLTAFLKKDGKDVPKPAGETGKQPAATPAPKPAGKKGNSTGGLDKAIAEGSVVITQEKVDAAGELTKNVGRAKRAVFDSNTGDITLTGNPQVEQGINTIVATEESTVMILNQEGRMRVIGPHRTVIKDTADANAR